MAKTAVNQEPWSFTLHVTLNELFAFLSLRVLRCKRIEKLRSPPVPKCEESLLAGWRVAKA